MKEHGGVQQYESIESIASYPCSKEVLWHLFSDHLRIIDPGKPDLNGRCVGLSDVSRIEYRELGLGRSACLVLKSRDDPRRTMADADRFFTLDSRLLPERLDFLRILESHAPAIEIAQVPESPLKTHRRSVRAAEQEERDAAREAASSDRAAAREAVGSERAAAREQRRLKAQERAEQREVTAKKKELAAQEREENRQRAKVEDSARREAEAEGAFLDPRPLLVMGDARLSSHIRMFDDRLVVLSYKGPAQTYGYEEIEELQWATSGKSEGYVRARVKHSEVRYLNIASDPSVVRLPSGTLSSQLETFAALGLPIKVSEISVLSDQIKYVALDAAARDKHNVRVTVEKITEFEEKNLLHSDKFIIVMDTATKAFGVVNRDSFVFQTYNPQDLISVEVFEDGRSVTHAHRARQIGAAMVGDWLAGPAGAVIGGLGAKQKSRDMINSLAVRIEIDDPKRPIIDLPLLSKPILKGGRDHKAISTTARSGASLLASIIRSAQASQLPQVEAPAADLAKQLTALANLHSSGLLNDEEFAAAKARLLGARE